MWKSRTSQAISAHLVAYCSPALVTTSSVSSANPRSWATHAECVPELALDSFRGGVASSAYYSLVASSAIGPQQVPRRGRFGPGAQSRVRLPGRAQ